MQEWAPATMHFLNENRWSATCFRSLLFNRVALDTTFIKVFYKGLTITSVEIIFPLANVYLIALGMRSITKTYCVRLQMKDYLRTQMFFFLMETIH